jgi:hypothetical protein
MTDFTFTNLESLSINWINDGSNNPNNYPSGESIDLSHGEARRCVWTWKVINAVRAGLVFVQCQRCKSGGQVIVGATGSLRIPCNVNVYKPDPILPT